MADDKSAGENELIGQVAGTDKLKVSSLFNVDGWTAVGVSMMEETLTHSHWRRDGPGSYRCRRTG